MDLGLTDRVAIVAAASSGLGKAVALALAQEGARIAICSRDARRIEAAASDIGRGVLAQAVDVSKGDDVKQFVQSVLDTSGPIDICITNAGGPLSKAFAVDLRPNVMSAVHFAREVLSVTNAAAPGTIHYRAMCLFQAIAGLRKPA